jgi:hypothetical protein
VPQFYLKGFTKNGAKNSRLFSVDIYARRFWWTSPAQVCAQRDFNRIEVEGLSPDALEKSLSQFESEAAKALRVIVESKSASNEEAWLYMLNLMSVLCVRNPAIRRNMEDFSSRLLGMMLEAQLATPERWARLRTQMIAEGYLSENQQNVTYEQLRRFVKEKEYTLEYPHGYHTRTEFHVQDTVLKTLMDRRWLLVSASKASGGFITSDHRCACSTLMEVRPRYVGPSATD